MDWESQDDGYMAKLLVPDGAKDIPVGTPVAVFVEDKVGPAHTPKFSIFYLDYMRTSDNCGAALLQVKCT